MEAEHETHVHKHPTSTREAVTEVLSASTAHGISRAAAAKSIPMKVMWSLLFVTFLALFSISAWSLIGRLVNITVVTYHEADKVTFEFPDLYFCPSLYHSGSIPYSLSESEAKLVNDEVERLNKLYNELYCDIEECRGSVLFRVLYIQLSMPVSLMHKYLMLGEQAFETDPIVYLQTKFKTNPAHSTFIHPNNRFCVKVRLNEEESSNINYKRATFFVWPFVDPYYPEFNYTGTPIKPIVNPYDNERVPFENWQIIDGDNSILSLGNSLIIVPKGSYPSLIHEPVLKLSAGMSHKISLEMVENDFSPELHELYCQRSTKKFTFEDHLTGEPVEFANSLSACFYDEMAARLHQRFNCLYSRHPRPWRLRHVPRVENMTEVHRDGAVQSRRFKMKVFIEDETKHVMDICKVKQPCSYKEYSASVTSDKWPQPGNKLAVYLANEQRYALTDRRLPGIAQLVRLADKILAGNYSDQTAMLFRRYVSDTLMEVEITVTSPMSSRKITAYSYSWVSFLADIGGTLGLYIGCSLMTIFELLELGYHLLIIAVKRALARKTSRAPEGDELEAMEACPDRGPAAPPGAPVDKIEAGRMAATE